MRKILILATMALFSCSSKQEYNCIECEYPLFGQDSTFYRVVCKEDVTVDDWNNMVDLLGSNDINYQITATEDTVLTISCYYVE